MWATSIGLTFSHRPVPGERKSGMPDGTEMPAPVSATTERAPATSSARRSAAAVRPGAAPGVVGAVSVGATSAPGEACGAFAQEGCDALFAVGAREHGGERLLLGLQAGVEI